MVLSWEGAAEVQSGDILLVRIDDSQLALTHSMMNQTVKIENDRFVPITLFKRVSSKVQFDLSVIRFKSMNFSFQHFLN